MQGRGGGGRDLARVWPEREQKISLRMEVVRRTQTQTHKHTNNREEVTGVGG
jgi:hypothetical protein